MPMEKSGQHSCCLVPLNSREPLWEWDVASDTLFLSHGLREILGDCPMPDTMAGWYALVSPETARELARVREKVISGKSGSVLQCRYCCQGKWLQEHILALERERSGRGTRLLGRIAPCEPGQLPETSADYAVPMVENGAWAYHPPTGRVWCDKICANILGYPSGRLQPASRYTCLMEVHPAERESLRRHYEMFCSSGELGDTITDIVRVQKANGDYVPVLLRGSAVERDRSGVAILVIGNLGRSGVRAAADSFARDDRLFHALNSMGSGQWNWDTRANAMYFCPSYIRMLGYPEDLGGEFARLWPSLVHPDDFEKMRQARDAVINGEENGDSFECTYRMRRANGEWAWIFDRGCVTWRDGAGRAGHMVGSITNITTAQAERDRLEDLVRHDSLTGLRSRAFCNLEIEHIEQNRIRPVAVISIDITGLKMVNDCLGHQAGDEVLTRAAALLRGALRASDCIARMGGDEFVVLLPNCSLARGHKLLGKVQDSFARYNASHADPPIFASCGLAAAANMEESMTQLLSRADDAMYEVKKEQRKVAHPAIKAWIMAKTGREVEADERL